MLNYSIKIVFILLWFGIIFPGETMAQLCQGSLGDPVVNITFGSGVNPGPPLNGLTNYSYFNNDCPEDGFYTIANSTSGCFNNTWHSVSEDHTPGDVNGYMMVVNASFNPGDFFVKKVDGLCPNTTYEFAAWILNVIQPFACSYTGSPPIKPNITFNIETTSGTVLQTYQTGDIDPSSFNNWKQYGFFFSTTTSDNSVVLRMTNNAEGGCGNDLLLDDITFRACGPLVTANINGLLDSADVCAGDNSVFILHGNVSSGYNDPIYQWQLSTDNRASWSNISGATDTVYNRLAVITAGTYQYRLTVAQRGNINNTSCYIASNVVAINVNKFPVPSASNHGSCIGDSLLLSAKDGLLFSWTGPFSFTSNEQFPFIANAAPNNNGKYYVNVTSAKGCTTVDSTVVRLSAKPVAEAGADADVCEGSGIQLNGTSVGNITSYTWTPASEVSDPSVTNPVAYPKITTAFIFTVSNNECKVSDSVLITVNKLPSANAGPDKVIISGQSAALNGAAAGTNINYVWTPNENITGAETLTPSVDPAENKLYTLTVISNKGCGSASDTTLVKVFQQLYIPNAFTPNGDGVNDTWFIETLEAYPGAEVKVYNRYGQVVFNNHGSNISWDGKYKGTLQTSGAYAYLIDLKNNTNIIKGVLYILL